MLLRVLLMATKRQSTLVSFLTNRDPKFQRLQSSSCCGENSSSASGTSGSSSEVLEVVSETANMDEVVITGESYEYDDGENTSNDSESGLENFDSPCGPSQRASPPSRYLDAESETDSTDSLCIESADNNPLYDAECCCAREKPYQPRMNYSTISKRKQGKCCHSFQTSWYSTFGWLSYCLTHNKVYCYYCRTATASRLVCFSKKNSDAFVSTGFNNWKKALKRFRQHESCNMHTESCMKLKSLQQRSVASQLSNLKATEQKCNREMLCKVLSSLKYLLRQGLAIRGHHEETGNLIQLLQCRAEDINGLKTWISKKKYLSHDIINEMIALMAHDVLRDLLAKIKAAEYFALIGDETRDISGTEQFAVSIRWVSQEYLINEDLITLAEVEQTDGASLTATLKNVLICNGLQISKCYGQAYDGASNMSGHLNGVAARIQKEQPKAHYVHCVAHSLNLCLQDCGKNCISMREA